MLSEFIFYNDNKNNQKHIMLTESRLNCEIDLLREIEKIMDGNILTYTKWLSMQQNVAI